MSFLLRLLSARKMKELRAQSNCKRKISFKEIMGRRQDICVAA